MIFHPLQPFFQYLQRAVRDRSSAARGEKPVSCNVPERVIEPELHHAGSVVPHALAYPGHVLIERVANFRGFAWQAEVQGLYHVSH